VIQRADIRKVTRAQWFWNKGDSGAHCRAPSAGRSRFRNAPNATAAGDGPVKETNDLTTPAGLFTASLGRVRKRHTRMFYRCLTHGALIREKDRIPFGWCFRTHPWRIFYEHLSRGKI